MKTDTEIMLNYKLLMVDVTDSLVFNHEARKGMKQDSSDLTTKHAKKHEPGFIELCENLILFFNFTPSQSIHHLHVLLSFMVKLSKTSSRFFSVFTFIPLSKVSLFRVLSCFSWLKSKHPSFPFPSPFSPWLTLRRIPHAFLNF